MCKNHCLKLALYGIISSQVILLGVFLKRSDTTRIGTQVSTKKLHDILPNVLSDMRIHYQAKPRAVVETWPKIIGKELASMTKAVRFEFGVLHVNVKNSTLLSLLNNPVDKQKILKTIRETLPAIQISNIVFRIG